MFKQPVQEFCKGYDAGCCSDDKYYESNEIHKDAFAGYDICDCSHQVFIFAENQKDETSGDAGQNHCADCDCSADEDEPQSVRSCGGGEGADYYAQDDTEDEHHKVLDFPFFYSPEYEY